MDELHDTNVQCRTYPMCYLFVRIRVYIKEKIVAGPKAFNLIRLEQITLLTGEIDHYPTPCPTGWNNSLKCHHKRWK